MTRPLLIAALAALGLLTLAGISNAAGSASSAATGMRISYAKSSCVPLPGLNEGQIRFFVQFVNTGPSAKFNHDIHFVWQRIDGSWKDSWLNVVTKGSLRVPGYGGKRYYAEFGADPSKPILRCGLKIGSSQTVHPVRVIR